MTPVTKEMLDRAGATPLERALIIVESGDRDTPLGDLDAVGDAGNAHGCLQIWGDYMKDAWPENARTAAECIGNLELSLATFRRYMARYATEKRLKRTVTDEDIARIHNGGPNGYKKEATIKYWRKVERLLKNNIT